MRGSKLTVTLIKPRYILQRRQVRKLSRKQVRKRCTERKTEKGRGRKNTQFVMFLNGQNTGAGGMHGKGKGGERWPSNFSRKWREDKD